jgi:acetyltransferase-like isoleucine patch superfamily enzyme
MKVYRYIIYFLRYCKYQLYYFIIYRKFQSSLIGIGRGVRLRIRGNSALNIGHKVFFDDFCSLEIDNGSSINIEEGVQFNRFCTVSARKQIRIGKDTIFGPNCKIYDHNHVFDCKSPVKKTEFKNGEVDIGQGCWFGANVVVCAEVKIGDFCVIGANKVVRHNVPSGTVLK